MFSFLIYITWITFFLLEPEEIPTLISREGRFEGVSQLSKRCQEGIKDDGGGDGKPRNQAHSLLYPLFHPRREAAPPSLLKTSNTPSWFRNLTTNKNSCRFLLTYTSLAFFLAFLVLSNVCVHGPRGFYTGCHPN
jgi:hypothetical protein